MHQSKYIMPSLGRKSVAIVLAWCAINVAIHVYFSSENRVVEAPRELSIMVWLAGAIYGFSSGACWIASMAKKASYRYLLRVSIAALSALLLTQFATDSWPRHVANLGGLLVFQCILFFVLRIPDWETRRISQPELLSTRRRHQFRIADVIIATTSIALLLSIGIRYTTPIDAFHYWAVMLMVWLACPLIAASLFTATMCKSSGDIVGWGVLATILAAGTAAGLSAAEYVASKRSVELSFWLPFYSNFVLGYSLTLVAVGIAGRVERSVPPGIEAATNDLDS